MRRAAVAWLTRISHARCGHGIVVETDPKNDDYRIVEGARQSAAVLDAPGTDLVRLPDEEEKARIAADPMYALEHDGAGGSKSVPMPGRKEIQAPSAEIVISVINAKW